MRSGVCRVARTFRTVIARECACVRTSSHGCAHARTHPRLANGRVYLRASRAYVVLQRADPLQRYLNAYLALESPPPPLRVTSSHPPLSVFLFLSGNLRVYDNACSVCEVISAPRVRLFGDRHRAVVLCVFYAPMHPHVRDASLTLLRRSVHTHTRFDFGSHERRVSIFRVEHSIGSEAEAARSKTKRKEERKKYPRDDAPTRGKSTASRRGDSRGLPNEERPSRGFDRRDRLFADLRARRPNIANIITSRRGREKRASSRREIRARAHECIIIR